MGLELAVTVDNFCRAESDRYFAVNAARGRFGVLGHDRSPLDVRHQPVIRMNRDTWYSSGVFDLTRPVRVRLPEAAGRFMSLMVINQDHYVKLVAHDPGEYEITADGCGTRYAAVVVRTLVNPDDPDDVAAVHEIQDRISASQADPGVLELPAWDEASLNACRTALLALAPFAPAGPGRFGDVGEVDPVRHLVGTAAGWGGNPPAAAMYFGEYPEHDEGRTPYVLHLDDVPVDGFWSVSVYDREGYFRPDASGAYSLNDLTAATNADGSTDIRFGGDPAAPNYLAIFPGWNYVLRLYRPRKVVIDGTWTPPAAMPVR